VADVKTVNQTGLFEDYNDIDLDGLLQGIEGRFDAKRYVTSIVTPEQIAASGAGDLAALTGGPVADEDQPLDHRGQSVAKGTTVGVLSTGSGSLGGAWDVEVDASTGQWTVWNYPVMSYDDGARTNALVGGSLLLALDGTRAEYIPLDGERPNFKQSQLAAHETVDGIWSVTIPGAGSGLDETAVQALIDSAVSDLLAGAPGALDTLNELAAALGDDANFAATVATALAAKQAASDVLTALANNGTPGTTGLALLLTANLAAAQALLGITSPAIYVSGQYTVHQSVGSTTNLTPNRLFYVPFPVYATTTFDKIALSHQATLAGAGSVARVGIYADAGGLPGALIVEAATQIDLTTAPALKPVSISQTLTPGRYWLAAVVQATSGAPTFLCGPPKISVPTNDNTYAGTKFENSVTGALPSTASPGTGNASNPPAIFLRTA
jgi:hypothetical protein